MRIDSAPLCCGDCSDIEPRTARCGFCPEDWHSDFRGAYTDPPDEPLFDARCLWLAAPNANVASECRQLLVLQAHLDPLRREQIEAQADRPREALWAALGLENYYSTHMPERTLLIARIAENISVPTFTFKRLFLRARPGRMCQSLTPMFPREHPSYPGHPSYPSGHATTMYAWAYLLSAKLARPHHHQQFSPLLLSVAASVAEGREWAGVHYPSDTQAGMTLGAQIAHAILEGGCLNDDHFALLMPGLT
jgi:PAP2 superfamily